MIYNDFSTTTLRGYLLMFTSFDENRSRFASVGVISTMPGELIDSIWLIIDMDLKGFVSLDNILTFDLLNNHGMVSMHFTQEDAQTEMVIDLPFTYTNDFPKQVYAYDDGQNQTILLPSEARRR